MGCIIIISCFFRAPIGYGIASIRVDGTDCFAVHNATKLCKEYILKTSKPCIIEAMAYRVGHHSTSDDSSAYRAPEEIDVWQNKYNPISKLRCYIEKQGWWNSELENTHSETIRKQILTQISISERKPKSDWQDMFNDVYEQLPEHLRYETDSEQNWKISAKGDFFV